jgi:hypothetical protein
MICFPFKLSIVSTIDSSDIHPFKQQSVKQICLVNDGGIQSHHNPGSSGGTGATEKRSAALCQEGGGPIEGPGGTGVVSGGMAPT